MLRVVSLLPVFVCLSASAQSHREHSEETQVVEEAPPKLEDPFSLPPDFNFHLQVRPRLEKSFGSRIGTLPGSRNYRVTHRVRLAGEAKWGVLRGWASVQDVRTWAGETNTLGDFSADGIDMHEGWLELKLGNHLLRVGRQELNIDGQRLVGAVDWTQQGRSFDGARYSYAVPDSYELAFFAARVPDGGAHDLFVGHGVGLAGPVRISVPLIFETNKFVGVAERGPREDEWYRFTGGSYIKGEHGSFKWRAEGYVQAGSDALAYMAGARASYEVFEWLNPMIWADYLSGDDPETNRIEVFDTLFGTNHKFYGFIDRFLNIPAHTEGGGLVDLAVKNTGKVGPGKLHVAVHEFLIPEQTTSGGQGLRGLEVDVVYTWPLWKYLILQMGVSGFLDQGAPQGRRIFHDWTYVQLDLQI